MDLHLSSSSSSSLSSFEEEVQEDHDMILLQPVLVVVEQWRTSALEEAVNVFARNAVREGARHLRVTSPTQYVKVDVEGVSARIVPLTENKMRGLQLIDLAFSGPFVEAGNKRLLFLRLQQELLGTWPDGERLCFIRVSDPILAWRAVFGSLHGWRMTDEDPPRSEGQNAPRRRFWTWHHPAHALFHAPGIPVSHTLSAVERLLVSQGSDEPVSYRPVPNLEVHVRMDPFVHPPVQQAQNIDDTETAPALHFRDARFFEGIVAHCRALGNPETEHGGDLLVVSMDHVVLHKHVDPRHVRALFAFVIAYARVFMRPLFVRKDVLEVLLRATEYAPFALADNPRPELTPLTNEDYAFWIPQRRSLDEESVSEPLVVEPSLSDDEEEEEEGEEEEEEDMEPRRKRQRLTYSCAQCCNHPARFHAALFLPMCSHQCIRDYYLIGS